LKEGTIFVIEGKVNLAGSVAHVAKIPNGSYFKILELDTTRLLSHCGADCTLIETGFFS
jgi:hypothetical protein